MEICKFYKVKTETHEKPGVNVDIPHCTHENAGKLSIKYLSTILGSSHVLKCKGDISKCQLPQT